MESSKLVLEAIALQKCIEATYNRTAIKLAPYILYTKHGELFVDAVTVEREGRPPKETKLGTFKLAGLTIREIISRSFKPEPLFNSADPKYAGATLFAVEAAA
ncbi:hypothetical protein ACSBM8_16455 [Sphingomonas sp. ASY06-1R]|jgi:hypothetical protein|uniref:hypothetical protein n=1 Tax=Sphingomonas sp. ASY06-1R TaxID=3445771 RepID=UPI003FA2ED60